MHHADNLVLHDPPRPIAVPWPAYLPTREFANVEGDRNCLNPIRGALPVRQSTEPTCGVRPQLVNMAAARAPASYGSTQLAMNARELHVHALRRPSSAVLTNRVAHRAGAQATHPL